MIDETLFEAEEKMEKAILVARDELTGIGRASCRERVFSSV